MTETDEELYLRYAAEDDDADPEILLTRYRDGFLFLPGFVRSEEDAGELMQSWLWISLLSVTIPAQRQALYHCTRERSDAHQDKAI